MFQQLDIFSQKPHFPPQLANNAMISYRETEVQVAPKEAAEKTEPTVKQELTVHWETKDQR